MATKRPDRTMDPFAVEFWEYTKKEELRLQKCSNCGNFRWPASEVCDHGCLSEDYEWELVSGEGTVLSWVIFHRQYFPEYPPDHPALAIELDEGPIFICTTDVDAAQVKDLSRKRMRVAWLESEDKYGTYNLPIFRPI